MLSAQTLDRVRIDAALRDDLIHEYTHRLLVLYHVDGLSMREISALVGRPWEGVRKHIRLGRKRAEGKAQQKPHGPKPRVSPNE